MFVDNQLLFIFCINKKAKTEKHSCQLNKQLGYGPIRLTSGEYLKTADTITI